MVGKSSADNLAEYPNYNHTKGLNDSCFKYASAYTETMLTRAQVEDPEIFAKKGMNKHEMQTLMVNNMCLEYSKLHSKVFRETSASIKEKNYLNDDIRRLYAGGQKFHPYL